MQTCMQRWARATIFWVRNRNSATGRKHFRNCNSATLKRNVAPQPQFRNRNLYWSPQLQDRTLRASIPQFSAYFCPWSGLKLIFFTPGIFCYGEEFKGTVERDFRLLYFFHESSPYGTLSHTLNYFRIRFQIHRYLNSKKLFPGAWYRAEICLEGYDTCRNLFRRVWCLQKFV